MNKIAVSMLGIALAVSVGGSTAFAKGKPEGNNGKKVGHTIQQEVKKIQQAFHEEKKEEREEKPHKLNGIRALFCLQVRPGASIPPGFHVNAWFQKLLCEPMPTSTPDTIAPIVSDLAVTGVGSSTATVSWRTDEASAGAVFFSTTTPVGTSTSIGTTTLSTAHSFTLNGLTAGTTYHFFVEAKDASGNRTTTAETAFTTAALDVSAPVISGVSLTKVDASSARVDWTTSESATGRVFYGPTSTLDLATAANVGTSTLSTAHSLTVSGLATGTVQTFVVRSADGSGNTATVTAGSLSF